MLRSAVVISAMAMAYAAGNAPVGPLFPPAHPYVETVGLLASHKYKTIPMGAVATLLCGFVNEASTPMNVSGIIGSLWSTDFSINYHNFTSHYIGELVDAEGERSMEYIVAVPFMPSKMDLKLIAAVIYEDPKARTQHAHVFYNETIGFSEAARDFHIRDYLPYLLGTVASAVALYVVRDLFVSAPRTVGRHIIEASADEEPTVDVKKLAEARKKGKTDSKKKQSKSGNESSGHASS